MYDALATVYDRLMTDVPYGRWADFIAAHTPNGEGIDLACGTGALTLELHARRRASIGVDSSAAMLRVAQEKALRRGIRTVFVQADMTTFAPNKRVSCVTCACDGVNYIARPAALFARVYDMLLDGGVFVFDISSAYKLRHRIGDNTFFYDDGDLSYVWRNRLNKKHVDMDLTFFERTGDVWRRSDETQRQYIHETDAILRALDCAGFMVQTFSDYTDAPTLETDERICFVCRRD